MSQEEKKSIFEGIAKLNAMDKAFMAGVAVGMTARRENGNEEKEEKDERK